MARDCHVLEQQIREKELSEAKLLPPLSILVTSKDVSDAIAQSKSATAAGCSGWKMSYVKLNQRGDPLTLEAFTKFLTNVLHGACSDDLTMCFNTGLSTPLTKANKGCRPINVGEVLLRIIATIVKDKEQKKIAAQ